MACATAATARAGAKAARPKTRRPNARDIFPLVPNDQGSSIMFRGDEPDAFQIFREQREIQTPAPSLLDTADFDDDVLARLPQRQDTANRLDLEQINDKCPLWTGAQPGRVRVV